jgi:hypothetical protein
MLRFGPDARSISQSMTAVMQAGERSGIVQRQSAARERLVRIDAVPR